MSRISFLAAIDIAIWDIFAQLANQPLHQLLGIKQDYVVPYGNGGWLADSTQEIQHDIDWYLERGCKYFKMRVGCENDLSRLKSIRQAFGNALVLAVDANQHYKSFELALEMSRYLADFNIAWFEEPLFSGSMTELAKLIINDFNIKNGKIWLPKEAGHGVTISKQALA